jgi:hypothetical protein
MSALATITAVFVALSATVAAFALFENQILKAIRAGKAIIAECSKKKVRLTRVGLFFN